jgi:hypothetical protein
MHEPRTQAMAAVDEAHVEAQVLVIELREWSARVGVGVPARFERSAGDIVRLTRNAQGWLRLIRGNKQAACGCEPQAA